MIQCLGGLLLQHSYACFPSLWLTHTHVDTHTHADTHQHSLVLRSYLNSDLQLAFFRAISITALSLPLCPVLSALDLLFELKVAYIMQNHTVVTTPNCCCFAIVFVATCTW